MPRSYGRPVSEPSTRRLAPSGRAQYRCVIATLPVPGRQRLDRPELAARVAAALGGGSVLLVAEAGFGKTMALEEALAATSMPAAWVRCSPADRDAAQLVLDVLGAIRRAVPGAADVLAETLAAATAPIDAAAACRRLVADLEELLVEPLAVVLDDAERLATSPGSLEVVQLLLSGAGRLRLAIATRRPLSLRLAKLSAAGAVLEIGPVDLAFDARECADLLALRRGRPAVGPEVEAVMETTEGWPLGIALMALARPGSEPSGARSRSDVFAFLAEEVVEQLAPAERDALLDSSLPRELTRELAEAVGLGDDFLTSTERRGLFLRAVDPHRRRFRYHPLFRDYLLGRFAAERDPAAARALHARTAGALDAAGEHGEAIEHWLAAGEHDAALEAMVADRDALLRRSRDAVRAALAQLPAATRASAGGQLLDGLLDWSDGRHAEAVPRLTRAVAAFREQDGTARREWTGRLALADAGYGAGELETVVRAADGFDEPHAGAAGRLAPIVATYAAHALADLGRREESVDLARRALAHPAGEHARPFEHERALLWEDLPAGRFGPALDHARAAVAALEDAGLAVELSTALAFLGAVHVAAGDADAALAAYGRAQQVADESAVAGYMADEMRWTRAEIHARTGAIQDAELELAAASPDVRSVTGRWRVEMAMAAIALRRGDPESAVAAAERALGALAGAQLLHRLTVPVALVPLLARAGSAARAEAVLADAIALCDERFPGEEGCFFAARLIAARAFLRHAAGDRIRAEAALRVAWTRAAGARPQLLRGQWDELAPVVSDALLHGALDPREAIEAIERAWPGGGALVALMEHVEPTVRRLATASAAASGHPDAIARVAILVRDADADVAASAQATAAHLRRDPPALAFGVLGGFSLRRGSWDVPEAAFGRPIAARALRFLLVHRGVLLPEDVLFEAFWPEKAPAAARRNLAVTLSLVRKVLDPPGAEQSVIESTERAYRLRLRERDTVDCDVFERAADAALAATGPGARELLERAERLWAGEPLPEDRYAAWSATWREELVDRYLDVLGALARLYGHREEHAAAIRAARKCVHIDPLNELWQRELIAAYARAGRTSHALRQYLECRRQLVDGLGVEPAEETSRLQRRILAGEAV